ncbi:MAG: hypothetical protein E7013_04535 [Alphaproteobacteria bacterium]|nr:hypothetical protein [Alphaproteobacteria bacterium]
MNKILSLGFFGCLFFSTYAFSYCSGMDVCCSPETEVYCPYSTSSEKCTAGCDCCDLSTHEVVNSELNEDYYTCCKKEEEKVYWNGSSVQCCGGKVWKKDENSEACCHGDKTTNPTEKVVSVKYASITDLQTCCDIKTYGDSPTAYWNGSSAQCCKGQVYEPWEGSGEYDDWACCDGEVYDVSDYEKGCCESPGSVTDALGGEQACCESGYIGIYMDGWAECCPNENVAQYGRDSYECCTLEEEGYSLVKALGAPFDKKSCCYNSTEAVWNGSYVQCCSEGEVAAQADSGKAQCCPKDKPQLASYVTTGTPICCEEGVKDAVYNTSQYQSSGCCTDGRVGKVDPSGRQAYCCEPDEKAFYSGNYGTSIRDDQARLIAGCCPSDREVVSATTDDGIFSKCCTPGSTMTACCQPGDNPQRVPWIHATGITNTDKCCPEGSTSADSKGNCCPAGQEAMQHDYGSTCCPIGQQVFAYYPSCYWDTDAVTGCCTDGVEKAYKEGSQCYSGTMCKGAKL